MIILILIRYLKKKRNGFLMMMKSQLFHLN